MVDLAAVDAKIDILVEQRQVILQRLLEKYGDTVREGQWFNDTVLTYNEETSPHGGLQFRFSFTSNNPELKKVTLHSSGFCLYGESHSHLENVYLWREEDTTYSLRTCDIHTLGRFLDYYRPKVASSYTVLTKLKVYTKLKEFML